MRRTTSATWSLLTSSSPPPPKSLSTRLHNIAEFQEFPGNRKKKTNGTAKAPHAEKEKKRPQLHLAPQMRTSRNPDTLRTRNIGTCHYSFRSIRSAIEVQSAYPLKALISLLFFSIFLLLFLWLEN